MCQIWMTPVSASAARMADWSIASTWVATRTRYRSRRSTQTPAKGASKKVGIWLAKPTTPRRTAEPVRRYTSQLIASRVTHVPISEAPWPAKNRR